MADDSRLAQCDPTVAKAVCDIVAVVVVVVVVIPRCVEAARASRVEGWGDGNGIVAGYWWLALCHAL